MIDSRVDNSSGMMLGNIMGVVFMDVGNDMNWRLMLGSTVVLPILVCVQVYFCPESPRWFVVPGLHFLVACPMACR